MGRLNLMDVRWEKIPLLWSTVKERRLTKGFSISMGGGGCKVYMCLLKNEAAQKGCTH